MNITLLMAPELIEEIGPAEWLREATRDESELFRNDHPQLNFMDLSGRPYFCMVVITDNPAFPADLLNRFKSTLRMRWLQIN